MQQLLHISYNPKLPDILYPRQPSGYIKPKGKPGLYYEDLPPRISFGPTIQKCFNGAFGLIYKPFNVDKETGKHNKEVIMYVYEGLPDTKTTFMSKADLKKKLWDYHVTDEIVVTSPIMIRKIAKIAIKNPIDKNNHLPEDKEVRVRAYNNSDNEERVSSMIITYKVLERYHNVTFK